MIFLNIIYLNNIVVLFILQGCVHDKYSKKYQTIVLGELQFFPEFYSEKTDLPSPALDTSGMEGVLVRLQDSLYTWFDATVENGDTFDYKRNFLGKGNQLLADEILGSGHIEVWRELNVQEKEFLKEQYPHLSPEQFEEMKEKITHLHTGEMVLYYINRYGFYEGHSDFRADPVTIAFIFGLQSVGKIHKAANGNTYQYFTNHLKKYQK